jgi:3-dehydroquinate dehydratase/shikimate dehydrogenase
MICITGNERRLDELAARLSLEGLHEVRLDLLEERGDELSALMRRHANRIVATCRGADRDLLKTASDAEVAWLDADREMLPLPFETGSRLIASFHDFNGMPADLAAIAANLLEHRPDAIKIAVTVSDAADLSVLRINPPVPAIMVGMGEAGVLSRIRYRHFGSPWTYVTTDDARATAPGQLTIESARLMGLPAAADAPFIALLGDERIAWSPGPRVYNALFRRRGLPWSYVPVVTRRPEESLLLLRELGALGASVTIPHKQAVLSAVRTDDRAARIGAANSIRFPDATNTDIAGIVKPLLAALESRPARSALILGDGGAARAAKAACEDLALTATLASRRIGNWAGRDRIDADVLINATPLTDEEVWPEDRPLRKEIVFDLAFGAGRSRLLIRAGEEGARAIGPEEMWIVQGAEQISWITGVPVSPQELRELLT